TLAPGLASGAPFAAPVRPPGLDGREQAREIEPRRDETVLARAVLDETVGDPDVEQRHLESLGSEQLAHSRSGASGHDILLERDDRAVCPRDGEYPLPIERFHEAHIEERRIEPLGY